jgi:oligoribonuclease NrnB/cAMP/cGMP phosphodiesterase (DHH superfamily)
MILDSKADTVVVYHDPCSDGFTSAWVAWRHLGDRALYYPTNYGQAPPAEDLVRGKDVLMLDFSYKRGVLAKMAALARSVTILDHHQSAIEELSGWDDAPGNVLLHLDKDLSGAALAWRHWYGCVQPPPLVSYVEDRDLWRWNLPHSRAYNAVVASHEFTFDNWDALAQRFEDRDLKLLVEGEAILRYQAQRIRQLLRLSEEFVVGGMRVLGVNTYTHQSEVAGELAGGRPFGCVWYAAPGGRLHFSLRRRDTSTGDVDLSRVARMYGGGGHRDSAGFNVSPSQLERRDGAVWVKLEAP